MSLSILFIKVVIWCLGAYRDLEQNYPIWVPCPKPIISLLILLIKMMISCLGASRALQLDFPIWAPCPKPFISLSVFYWGLQHTTHIYIYIYIYMYKSEETQGKRLRGNESEGSPLPPFPNANILVCSGLGGGRIEGRGSILPPTGTLPRHKAKLIQVKCFIDYFSVPAAPPIFQDSGTSHPCTPKKYAWGGSPLPPLKHK
jgi:hypothetical protein